MLLCSFVATLLQLHAGFCPARFRILALYFDKVNTVLKRRGRFKKLDKLDPVEFHSAAVRRASEPDRNRTAAGQELLKRRTKLHPLTAGIDDVNRSQDQAGIKLFNVNDRARCLRAYG